MTFNGWAALYNGVLLSGSCDDTQETFNALCPSQIPADDEDGQLAIWIDALTAPPEGLGRPPTRNEDLVYPQRDGSRRFNDYYEDRIITLQVSVCPDDCPNCGGPGSTGMTARQKAALIEEAWQRQCCDGELVIFTDCNGVLDPDTKYAPEEGETLRTNLALNPAAIEDGSKAEWIPRYPLKGDYSYETVDGPLDLQVASWVKKEFTDTQTANDDGMDHYQSVDAAPPLGIVETLDWTETWADTSNWTGSGWLAGGGEVESTTPLATIYRDTSDIIGKVVLTDTFNMTVQLLDEDENVLASVIFPPDPTTAAVADVQVFAVDDNIAFGDGAGTTTLQLDYVAGTLDVSGTTPAPWSAAVTFAGTPTRIKLVAPDGATSNGDFTTGVGQQGDYVAVGPSGDVYVLDSGASEVLKFDSDGTPITSWAVLSDSQALAVDASDDVFTGQIADSATGAVSWTDSVGAASGGFFFTPTFANGVMAGLDVDSAGNIYVLERSGGGAQFSLKKFDSAGTLIGVPYSGASTNASGLNTDAAGTTIYRGDATGVTKLPATFFATSDPVLDIAVDNSGYVYVAETGAIRKYSSSGTPVWAIATPIDMQSLDVSDDGHFIYGVGYDNTVYRWVQDVGHTDEMEAYAIQSAPIARQLEPNTQYTVSNYGYAESATSAPERVVIRMHDGAGNWLAAESAGATVETNGAWARSFVTFTTPALPGSGVIYLAGRSEWVKTDWQIGDILGGSALMIEEGPAPTAYFDGNTVAVDETDGQIQYSWTDIADASPSIETFHEWAYLTNNALNGPYGMVGRSNAAPLSWDGSSKCADISLEFRGDPYLYILDDCGTPGFSQCVDITPGVPEYQGCFTLNEDPDSPYFGRYVMCFEPTFCFTDIVPGTGPEPVTFTVTGTQRVYPEITLMPDLPGPITIENISDGTFITYYEDVQGEPVVINTQDGTAYQGDASNDVTQNLGGNVTTFSLLPGPYEFRVLLPPGEPEEGLVRLCFRPAVISA